MPDKNEITAYFTRHSETDHGNPKKGAILVSDSGRKADGIWLPKSQITWRRLNGPDPTAIEVTMPYRLAKQKGIVD